MRWPFYSIGGLNRDDFDVGWDDTREDYSDNPGPNGKICKYCGEEGLAWEHLKGKWKLVNLNDEIHICKFDLWVLKK